MQSITLINGDHSFSWYDSSHDTILRTFEGFEYAQPIVVIENLPGQQGAHYITSKFGRRVVSFQGDIVGSDIFTKRRELLSAMEQGNLKTLKFTTYDDLDLQIEGEVTRVLNPYTHAIHTFLIEFTSPDYRLFSQELHNESTSPTNATGGSPLPTALPMSFASPSGTENLEITNAGDTNSPPILRIHGPGESFVIQNTTTGEIMQVDITLASSNDVVEIDIKNKTAYLNTVTNVYGLVTGDWFELAPGMNSIYFNLLSLSASLTSLEVEWRDAYKGL